MIAPVKGDASVPTPLSTSPPPIYYLVEAESLFRASDLLDWWTPWENLCLPPLACAHQRQ